MKIFKTPSNAVERRQTAPTPSNAVDGAGRKCRLQLWGGTLSYSFSHKIEFAVTDMSISAVKKCDI